MHCVAAIPILAHILYTPVVTKMSVMSPASWMSSLVEKCEIDEEDIWTGSPYNAKRKERRIF